MLRYAPRYEDLQESGGIAPRIPDPVILILAPIK
jgi:hypothetical protein